MVKAADGKSTAALAEEDCLMAEVEQAIEKLKEQAERTHEAERLTAADYATVINCTDEETKEAVRNRPPYFHVEV